MVDLNEYVPNIPSSPVPSDNPVVEFPIQSAVAPTSVIPGSDVQKATAMRQTGILKAPEGPSNWERISGILSILGAALGEAQKPPSAKTGAPAATRERVMAQWRETGDRQAMAYLVQLRNLSMTEPTKASAALEDFMGRATAAGMTGGLSPQVMNMALQFQTELRRGQVVPKLLEAIPGGVAAGPRLNFLRGALTSMGSEAFLHLDSITKIMGLIPEREAPNYQFVSSKENGIWAINPKNPTDRTQIVTPGTDLNQEEFMRLGAESVGGRLLRAGKDPNKLWRDLNSTDTAVKAQAMSEVGEGLVKEQKDRLISQTGFGQDVNTALGRMKVNPLEVHDAMRSGDPARQVWAAGLLENIAKAQDNRKEMDRRAMVLATAQAQLQTQLDTPIGLAFKEKAHQWLDREALQGRAVQEGARPVMRALDVKTPSRDAFKVGVNLSDEQFKDLKTMQQAHSLLNGLERTLNTVFTTNNPSLAAYRAGKMKLQALTDSNPDVAKLKAAAGQLYSLASAFGAGTGRALSDKDMAIIIDMVNLGFLQTQASSQARMDQVRRVILNAERIAAGVDPLPDPPVPALKGTWGSY